MDNGPVRPKWFLYYDAAQLHREAAVLEGYFHECCRHAEKFSQPDAEQIMSTLCNAVEKKEVSAGWDGFQPFELLAQQLKKFSYKRNWLLSHFNENGEEAAHEVFFFLLAECELRRQAKAMPVRGFEEEICREHEKREWQLEALNALMHSKGKYEFNAHELFDRLPLALGRMFHSNVVIMPYLDKDYIPMGDYMKHCDPWFLLPSKGDAFNGLNYTFNFFAHETKDRNGRIKEVAYPAVCLDAKVVEGLATLQNGSPAKKSAARVLERLQSVFTLTTHDFIHQAVFHTKGLSRPQKSEGGMFVPWTMQGVQDIYDPLEVWNRCGRSLEKQAELLNRLLWQNIFEKEKNASSAGPVKCRVLRQFAVFFYDLEQCKQEWKAGESKSAHEAERWADYLAVVGASRFFRLFDPHDPDLANVKCEMPDKTLRTVEEAIQSFEKGNPSFLSREEKISGSRWLNTHIRKSLGPTYETLDILHRSAKNEKLIEQDMELIDEFLAEFHRIPQDGGEWIEQAFKAFDTHVKERLDSRVAEISAPNRESYAARLRKQTRPDYRRLLSSDSVEPKPSLHK